ncbi:hypothetical protein L8U98_08035 [Campylobacter sp. RKI_CA19_01128]|uniref:hypothetical protein n=1 Tax=unclassified Campylobacter TaxID=2593542 RepID=UPI0021E7488E|nr:MULTISPECIES: hypothetical protein [unclassified Campylobacter]MCV3349844.1 hypothetical protein [Campylobacter sp. RKI_CA19_01127]MCV3355792.1 hypothetical protein [Campylobacter sp. RKI_CA19_01128]HEC1777199.1 hypothetical protein [Campylobacter lari]
MYKNTKLKITFVVLFGLILINIGILFISKNEIFTKTLIGLIATTFILYYVLAWINTIKSIKDNKYIKPAFKDILFSILKSPYYIIRFFLIGRIKYLGNNENNLYKKDINYILENARAIGNDIVTQVGNVTFIGNKMVTKIGNVTFIGNDIVTQVGNVTFIGNKMVLWK